ncbi:MAG: glutathione S-transferase N-terminal domain-containing protein, partial [Myxococcales bacterium]|nr:glutathione S-transferase N-terminal domain-containing protein [Myxococcales bacterium]
MATYRHYGWPVSPYSGKTRAYLKYKDVNFDDIESNLVQLYTAHHRKVGRPVMPVVHTPEGTVLQDTTEIIDWFESRFPSRSVYPESPVQTTMALLIELLADEWLPLIALHSRWNNPKNSAWAVAE